MQKILIILKSFLLLGSLAGASAVSSEVKWKIEKVSSVGYLKNQVIFQSRDLKYVKSLDLFKGKMIAQWGVHVFEVGVAYYKCQPQKTARINICKFVNYEPKSTFEKCHVLGTKATCQKQLKSRDSGNESNGDFRSDDLVDSIKDQMHREVPDENEEYPDRDPENVDSVVIGF